MPIHKVPRPIHGDAAPAPPIASETTLARFENLTLGEAISIPFQQLASGEKSVKMPDGLLKQELISAAPRPETPTGILQESPATIADLAGYDRIQSEHILEAIQYRSLDRKLFS